MEAAMHSMRSDIKRTVLLEGLRSCGKGTTICKIASEACPEKSKAGPDRMEDVVVTFEGSLDRMEATDVEVNPEETEAAVGRQELFKEEMNVDSIRSLEDRYGDRRWVVRLRRGPKKRTRYSVGSRQKLSAARKRLIGRAVLAVGKEIFVGLQTGTALVKETRKL
jgi:hypothetical protein